MRPASKDRPACPDGENHQDLRRDRLDEPAGLKQRLAGSSKTWIGSIGRNGRISAAPAMLNMLPKFELEPIRTYFDTF
jgi:hypothetical protein